MNKKSAFSLADVLLTLLLIGVVSVAAIHTMAHLDNKSVKYLYSSIYHSLDKALYNSMTFTNLKNPFVLKEYKPDAEPPEEVEISQAEHTKRLCLMLIEYINTTSAACENPAVSDKGDSFDVPPHFITVNKVRVYLSGLYPQSKDGKPLPNQDHYFFIIYADINGTKKPNSMDYAADPETHIPTKEPDIFAFAALDIGRICPLGIAEYSSKYMQTRITYNQTKEESFSASEIAEGAEPDVETVVKRYSKVSKPYYISKAEAWGYGLDLIKDEADFLIDQNPYTYNDYVKSRINKKSKIYSFLKKNTFPLEGVTLKSGKFSEGGYECVAGSDLECDIIIDKFLY